jgi:hypothetical protein
MQKWMALRAAVDTKAMENVDVELLRQDEDAIDANGTLRREPDLPGKGEKVLMRQGMYAVVRLPSDGRCRAVA